MEQSPNAPIASARTGKGLGERWRRISPELRSEMEWSLFATLVGGAVLVGLFLVWDLRRSVDPAEQARAGAGLLDLPMLLPPPRDDERVSTTTTTSAEIVPLPDLSSFVITFEEGERLTRGGMHTIQRLADVLHAHPETEIKLDGYTDSRGASDDNRVLAFVRSRLVKERLMDHGIEGRRLHAGGHGESSPVASNETPAGRAANRRVEVSTFPTK